MQSNKQLFQRAQLTLGIEAAHDLMCVIIPRGTQIPCSKTQFFSTYTDHQVAISIQVYQGVSAQFSATDLHTAKNNTEISTERTSTRENQFLGRFELSNLSHAPRGHPKIALTFHLNEYGLLNVEAQECSKDDSQNLTVLYEMEPPSKYWNPEFVAQVLHEAATHRRQDEALQQNIAAKSRLQQYVWGLHSSLVKHPWRSILSSDEQNALFIAHESAITWLRIHGDTATTDQYESRLKQLEEQCQQWLRKLYQGLSTASSHIPARTVPNTSDTHVDTKSTTQQQQQSSHHSHDQTHTQPHNASSTTTASSSSCSSSSSSSSTATTIAAAAAADPPGNRHHAPAMYFPATDASRVQLSAAAVTVTAHRLSSLQPKQFRALPSHKSLPLYPAQSALRLALNRDSLREMQLAAYISQIAPIQLSEFVVKNVPVSAGAIGSGSDESTTSSRIGSVSIPVMPSASDGTTSANIDGIGSGDGAGAGDSTGMKTRSHIRYYGE